MAKDGATNIQIADAIGVTSRTIDYWLAKDHDLFRAIKDNKNVADMMVEASLFQRAIGYQRRASRQYLEKKLVHDEETGEAELKTVMIDHEYIEHLPPDTVAGIFWLKNRQPERWREKPQEPDPKDNGQTTIVYDTEWGGTGEPDSPSHPQDSDGEPK